MMKVVGDSAFTGTLLNPAASAQKAAKARPARTNRRCLGTAFPMQGSLLDQANCSLGEAGENPINVSGFVKARLGAARTLPARRRGLFSRHEAAEHQSARQRDTH